MVSQDMLRFRKGDLLAVLLVLLLAGVVAFAYWPRGGQTGVMAEIYQNGSLVRTVSLAEDQTFTLDGKYVNEIQVQQGRIAIIESDCPGTDCVFSGFIGTPNRSIVCLPNGVEIRVVGGEADIDFVVR